MRWLSLLLLPMLAAPAPAQALESAAVTSARATATLVSDTDAVAPGQSFHLALRLRLAPGWHSYWRNPGDAGVAPELAYTLPPGFTAGPIAWPAPAAHAEGPLMTYGYEGEVLLASNITVPAQAAAATVRLHASWLVCANICVPEEGDFALTLPQGTPAPSAQSDRFAQAAAQVPQASPWLAELAPDGRLRLAGNGLDPAAVRSARFFPDLPGQIVDSAPQPLGRAGDALTLELATGPDFRPGTPQTGVIVLRDAAGFDRAVHVAAAPVAATASAAELAGLALLGGLILNLMPCVFPILALKAVGLASLAGRRRGHAWGHALAYALGVVATFLGLALVLLALRQLGVASGWGFQFQSPVFVAAMALLLFAVGLNLSGVFAVGGPVGAGQDLAGRGGMVGSFFTGLLAVLVATPCTAPFMGAAIAGGLAGSGWVTLAVFLAMGIGLALPYVLLAVIPAVGRALPRPGAWMRLLQQVLAFPMYGASAWLVWVLSQESGSSGVLAAGAGLVLLGFAGWALGLAQSLRPGRRRAIGATLAAVAAVAAVAAAATVLPLLGAAATPPARTAGEEPFSTARLAALRAAGTPVFVNLTAAWCVTCLLNERTALASDRVAAAFAAHGVAYLKGDWTRQDPEISRFLQAQQREGVPFYALFPAGGGAPVVLPQILSVGDILATL